MLLDHLCDSGFVWLDFLVNNVPTSKDLQKDFASVKGSCVLVWKLPFAVNCLLQTMRKMLLSPWLAIFTRT